MYVGGCHRALRLHEAEPVSAAARRLALFGSTDQQLAKPSKGMVKEVTYEDFVGWTSTCGVRHIQPNYEDVLSRAEAKGRSVQEEMKAQGYENFEAFSKSCPQFSLFCWPSEFAELGSGYVLYFHFLTAMIFMLGLLFLLQLPVVAAYGGEDSINLWHWADSWTSSFDGSDPCACIGDNKGITSLSGVPIDNYGKTCYPWDKQQCQDGGIQSPGLWCCTSWCWADASRCSTSSNEDDPWLSSRRYARNGVVLVRATASCGQDDTDTQQCVAMGFTSNAAFNEPGTEEAPASGFIDTGWLTPGNYGPNGSEDALIPTMYLIAVFGLIGIIFCAYFVHGVTDQQVDGATTSPNDFAVLVRGLPTTATDEHVIKAFFEQNAVKGKSDTEVVKVVIGWDFAEFREKMREMRGLKERLKALDDLTTEEARDIRAQITNISSWLQSAGPDAASRLRSSGIVVVTFRHQTDMRACVDRWQSFWGRWFYCDSEDLCCIPGVCKGAPLPKFPIGDPPVPVHVLSIERAANPGDIHWEELGVEAWERRKMLLKTNGAMFGLILLSFFLTWGLNVLQESIKEGGGGNATIGSLSFLPAIVVALLNGALSVAALYLGDKEYHETWTEQEFSQAIKMTVAMVVNTGGVLYFVNAQPKEWYQIGRLVDDIARMLILNCLLPPFVALLDLPYVFKTRKRSQLTQEKVDDFNEALQAGSDPKADADAKKRAAEVRQEIEMYKSFFAPSALRNARRYANSLKTFFCCLIYSPVLPYLSLIGCIGLSLQYWVDKYMLLRWSRRPPRPANAQMAMLSTRVLKMVAPGLLSFCFWLFLTPSWANKGDVLSKFIIALLASLIFCAIPMRNLQWFFCCRCCTSRNDGLKDGEPVDYYKAQYMWPKEMKYHKDHFVYKMLPEAKNPEHLQPGVQTELGLEDLKGSYGAAAVEVVEQVGETAPTYVRVGAGIITSGYSPGAAVGTSGAGTPATSPAPATYGAPAVPFAGVAPSACVGTGYSPGAPTLGYTPGGPVGGGAPGGYTPGAPVGGGGGGGNWEYETGSGFQLFNADCQEYLESKYRAYRNGSGNKRINVRTAGMQISVDFEKMTSKPVDGHKLRAIRRRN